MYNVKDRRRAIEALRRRWSGRYFTPRQFRSWLRELEGDPKLNDLSSWEFHKALDMLKRRGEVRGVQGRNRSRVYRMVNRESVTQIDRERDVARKKALDAMARYKFQMFGYWAGIWVHLNRLASLPHANAFRGLVEKARRMQKEIS